MTTDADTSVPSSQGTAMLTPFSLSVLTVTKGNASKQLLAGANGHPIKGQGSLAIATGMLEHVQVAGLEGLKTLLAGVTAKQALVHGVVKGSLPGHVAPLVTTERLKQAKPGTFAPGTIARSLEYLAYPPEPFLLMFDRDDNPEDPTKLQSVEDLIALLTPLLPSMDQVGMLVTTSTSSGIRSKATDEWLIPPTGFHAYCLARGDLHRFVDLLKVRLWNAGYGYCKLSTPNKQTGVAAVLERAAVDLTVFSPERLDYVAGARIAKDAPFYQDRGEPRLIDGAILDLDRFADVTTEERAAYTERLTKAKADQAPDRFQMVAATIQASDPTLPPDQVAALAQQRLVHAEEGWLPPDYLLEFFHRTKAVAVQDLSAEYDGLRLADPAEPTYRDGTDAILHWRGGDWLINSFAHGTMRTYRAVPTPLPDPDEEDWANLQQHVPGAPPAPEAETEDKKETHVDTLLRLAEAAQLLWTTDGQLYAYVPVNGHHEVLSVGERGGDLRKWLVKRYRDDRQSLPSTTAIGQVMEALIAEAKFDGTLCEVYTRSAYVNDKLYVDLANDHWQVVEIDVAGWRVLDRSPVYFRRTSGMLPLPIPETDGTAEDLYAMLPVKQETPEAKLLIGWLFGTLQPEGARAHLAAHGEQGSAKSTTTRMLRQTIDPNKAPTRSLPKEEKDLVLAASHGSIVGLENVSHLADWQSDALCCLSTGAGLGTRQLYTDSDEIIFAAQRPVILNGIAEVCVRGDLLDRTLVVMLPAIDTKSRKRETDLWTTFHTNHARVLGALLHAASHALARRDTLNLPELPRLADFAVWVEAAAPTLGMEPKEFLRLMHTNRMDATAIELDATPLSATLLKYGHAQPIEQKTYKELLDILTSVATAGGEKPLPKPWPRTPRGLAGDIRRLAPALRAQGWTVILHPHTMHGSTVTLLHPEHVTPPPPSAGPSGGHDDAHDDHDDWKKQPSCPNDRENNRFDDYDDYDGYLGKGIEEKESKQRKQKSGEEIYTHYEEGEEKKTIKEAKQPSSPSYTSDTFQVNGLASDGGKGQSSSPSCNRHGTVMAGGDGGADPAMNRPTNGTTATQSACPRCMEPHPVSEERMADGSVLVRCTHCRRVLTIRGIQEGM